MSEESQSPDTRARSEIVPLVVAALLCDSAFQDPATGKTSLIGVFDRVHSRRFPTVHPSMHLFLKITDAEGVYDLNVKVVQVETMQVLEETTGPFEVEDRLNAVSILIPISRLRLPSHGRYDFQVWTNGAYLGSATLDAVLLPAQEESND